MISSRYNKIICPLILSLFLTGCWDYRDINKRTIGIAAGVDDLKDGVEFVGEKAKLWSTSLGKNRMFQITETYKYRSSGTDLEKARSDYDVKVSNPDFAGATRVFVFSKRYAEKKGIEAYINRLYFLIGLRSSVMVAVSQEPLEELFSKKIENDISIGYGIEDTVRYLDQNGMALNKTVQEIESDIQFGNIGDLLPYITQVDNTIKYLGFAVIKDSKLVGTIKREEGNGFLLVLSKNAGDTRYVQNPGDNKNLISIKSKLAKRSIKTSYEDNKINIYIDLKLKSQVQYEESIRAINEQDKTKLEEILANRIKEDVLSAATRSQNEFKSDVFGFARYFKGENIGIYRQINWKEEYPKAIFHVNVKTNIVNTNFLDPNARKPN